MAEDFELGSVFAIAFALMSLIRDNRLFSLAEE